MKHGVWLTSGVTDDPARVVEWGVAAEEAGWDGVFVSDSLPYGVYPEPWVVLAGIAARTADVTLGTWVVPVPRRQPWQLAKEVATLDRLSGGRVMLGTGLGNDDEYDAFGRPYDPPALGDRLDESLDVVAGLWAGEPFSYDGEHFTLTDAEVQPTPVQEPRVPILSGCWWPNKKPLHRGARWDGIMPFWPSFTGEGTGPRGEASRGTPEEEVRESLAYYHGITDDPGEILVPTVPSMETGAFVDLCDELGATWVLTTDLGEDPAEARETIGDGPPG